MQLTPRAYQLSIFESVMQRGNTLVVLPTGLGKTLIALMLIKEKMKEGRCLFLTPTKPLAKQHAESIKSILGMDDAHVSLVTGEMAPEKRKKEYEKDVIVSTPQTIRNDIENKRVGSNFRLVIVDECLDGNAKIRLFNNSEVSIKKLVQNKKKVFLQSYNKERNCMEVKEIIAFHKIPCKKKFLGLELEDVTIKCTEDHLIFCNDNRKLNWKQAKSLKAGDMVAVCPFSAINFASNHKKKDIINDKNIAATYSKSKRWSHAKQHYYRTLQRIKDTGIFPLNYNNPKLLTIARLFGYAMGDGWLTKKNKQPSV